MKYRYFASNLMVLWFLIVLYRTNPYYIKFLSMQAQLILLALALIYTIGGSLYYYRSKNSEPTHAYVAMSAIKKWISQIHFYLSKFPYNKNYPLPTITSQEKNAILFLLVKAFYLPVMINFFTGNTNNVVNQLGSYLNQTALLAPHVLYTLLFPMLINMILIIDTILFTTGYAVESKRCHNVVNSVEPTVFGWAVALVCYPPFNGLLTNYISWYTVESPVFNNVWLSTIAGAAMVLCYSVYLWASFSLGWKCSNLTSRGIVMNGVYAYVRHPAYIAKNIAWWIGMLPAFSIPAILSMAAWSFIYFLRAITEERHLLHDPDYQEYCKKVRYRFIPHIY